ncbi:hypothetical protein [Arthrobacter pigmenti]
MFTIHAPDASIYAKTRRVLDPESGITLEFVGATGRSPGRAFILSQNEVAIPFDISFDRGAVDHSTGEEYTLMRFGSFGTSMWVRPWSDVPPYTFSSVAEEQKWKNIAAEALVVCGTSYNGLDFGPDHFRVELNGNILSRRDFGYTS